MKSTTSNSVKFLVKNNQHIFEIFTKITQSLNKIGITPIIYGSLGLYLIVGEHGKIGDIDIIISDTEFKTKWKKIIKEFESHGYFIDIDHIYEFIGKKPYIGFSSVSEIIKMIKSFKTETINNGSIKYKQLSVEAYLKLYKKGMENKHRFAKIHKRRSDLKKIKLCENYLSINI